MFVQFTVFRENGGFKAGFQRFYNAVYVIVNADIALGTRSHSDGTRGFYVIFEVFPHIFTASVFIENLDVAVPGVVVGRIAEDFQLLVKAHSATAI